MTPKAKVVDIFANTTNSAAVQAAQWRTTDIANAQTFIDAHGDHWRYNRGHWR